MFEVTIYMWDGKIHHFTADSATNAVLKAEKECPGYRRVVAKSETALVDFSHKRRPVCG